MGEVLHLDDAVGGGEFRRPDDPAEMKMDPQKDDASGRKRGAVAREVTGGQTTLCGVFASGSQRQEKDGSLKDMQSTLKAVEKEWRKLFNEELVPTLQQWAARKR